MALFYFIKTIRVATSLVLLSTVFLLPLFAHAQSGDTTSAQEQCFETLKENLTEAGIFAEPLLSLSSQSYSDIAPLFGDKKKMLTSFDLTIDEPILGIRLYSFGDQTGYTHPPKTVLPIYTESDTWGDPVKEYVLAEEYVTDPQGKEHFLNCVFLHIESNNPANVTQENYAYDGTPISLVKNVADGTYKAWYNQAPSFDYNDNHFVTWKRMVVYPESAQNSYFNRYSVIDAYPASKVDNFEDLQFFDGKTVTYSIVPEAFPEATYSMIDGATGETATVELPLQLLPPPMIGINYAYRLASYYQAIEAQFPEFSALLSMQGALKYSTYKALVTKADITDDEQLFVARMFGNNPELDAYYFAETKESNPEFDTLIELIKNGDETLERLAAGETLENLTTPPEIVPSPAPVTQDTRDSKTLLYVVIIILAGLFVGGILYKLKQNNVTDNTNTV